MRNAWIGLSSIFVVVVCGGCGGDGGSVADAGMDAAADATTDARMDATSSGDAGEDAGPGERMRTAYFIGARNLDANHELFFRVRDCKVEPLGYGCTSTACTEVSPAGDFGQITVSSGGTEISQSPGAGGTYADTIGSGRLWMEGADVRFQAEGNDFPELDETLIGPGDMTVESPTGDVTLPADGPLEVDWSGTSVGNVAIVFLWNVDGDSRQLRCSRPASDGMAAIPQEILEQVGDSGQLAMVAENRQLITIDSDTEALLLARAGDPFRVSYSKP